MSSETSSPFMDTLRAERDETKSLPVFGSTRPRSTDWTCASLRGIDGRGKRLSVPKSPLELAFSRLGMSTRTLFVTTALPYANAPFHIGHIMEYIQADIWVRFQRMQGHVVHFVGADDAHGAPIMLAAEKAGKTPEAFVAEIARGRRRYLEGFHVSSDNWHSTHSRETPQPSQDISRKLKAAGLVYAKPLEQFYDPVKRMFLADRYIKGECPVCGAKDQYGDACENCSSVYSATELRNPYSVLSGAKPLLKSSEHFFFRLSDAKCKAFIKRWIDTPGRLQPQVVNKAKEWLEGEGESALSDWDISRDPPYFGIRVPDIAEEKYLYVWLDAPIGYFGSLKNYCQKKGLDFDQFVKPGRGTEMVHFIGKDIIYFHTLFWPAMLEFSGYKPPDVGRLVARELEHRRPEERMEIDDVFADEVDHLRAAARLHELVEVEALLLAVVLEAREVADRRVEPNVQILLLRDVGHADAEVGRIARDVPVGERAFTLSLEPFLRLVHDLRLQAPGGVDPALDERLALGIR